ncbi:MAG: protein-L-isoaspartate(D-aspartate) O-methyltransferase [Alphaproteobacteria bacterium]
MTKRGIGRLLGGILAGLVPLASAGGAAADPFADRRAAMVEAIRAYADSPGRAGALPLDPRVLDVMREVPRHHFVPETHREHAYEDRPLPIGLGQTISQPYIVALMTSLMQPQPDQSVLEVGTGSGYQAAVLARLVARVHTIEIVPDLGRQAASVLERDYPNVAARIGDGYRGWPEAAPFDAIMVTAAAPYVPQPLVDQLKPGGRMVVPVGPEFAVQNLMIVHKHADGSVTREDVLRVQFVPLTGER